MSDFYFSPESLGFFHLFEDEEKRAYTGKQLEGVFQLLSDREKAVLNLRFGLSGSEPQTLRQIAEHLEVSHTTVACDIKSAIKKVSEGIN